MLTAKCRGKYVQKRERLALSLWLKKLAKFRNWSKDRHPGTKDVKTKSQNLRCERDSLIFDAQKYT
jgi:hypothetical protein